MLTLTCHSCGLALEAATEDELVELALSHATEHDRHRPPAREHVLRRIRRHNAGPPGPDPA